MTRVVIPLSLSPASLATRRRRALPVRRLGGETMGTSWSVLLVPTSALPLEDLRARIQAVLDGIVAEMSHWEPASCLGRFNRAPPGSWHVLPAGFCAVLGYALSVAAASGGAFDPTAGRLVELWGFGPDRAESLPPAEHAIRAGRAASGWRRIGFDRHGRRARQPGGLHLDLSAVAKGYAVDRIAELLQHAGVADLLVEIGGELRGRGVKPDGTPWWVEVEEPRPAAAEATRILVALHGLSIATSGDYRRFVELDGRRHSHSLDPRDGWPIRHGLASVSVLHPACMVADALSTMLTVLGPEAGPAYARRNGIAARFVSRTADGGFAEQVSPAFAAMLD